MEDRREMAPVMNLKDWLKTMVLMIIPIANIIFLIIWATSSDSSNNPNRKNWARAQLIFMAIGILLSIVFFILAGIAGMSMYRNGYY